MKNNIHGDSLTPRGRPEEPLEVTVEFIQSEEANERWKKIFELLEAQMKKQSSSSDSHDHNHEQLTIFDS